MRRKIPRYLRRYFLLHERAGRPVRGETRRVRMQKERKRNIIFGNFKKMLKGGRSYTPKEFVQMLNERRKNHE